MEQNVRLANQTIAKLDQMQEELLTKHKKNSSESVEFFNDLFVQSRHILANSKFQSPMDGLMIQNTQFTPF